MTHIVLISPCMGGYGGLESFVLTIARGIAKIPDFSVEVVFKEAGSFSLHEDLKFKLLELPFKITFCTRSSLALWRSIRRADLVHLQNPCPDVAVMARIAGKPLLINIINHLKPRAGLHEYLWKLCLYLAQRRFYISNFVRRTWENSVLPWPGSFVVFPLCELAPLSPLPLEERSGFVFVARWIENKGLDTLVESYARSGLSPEKWPLRLIGDGPMRPRILSLLRKLGLEGKVKTPGFLGEIEKADFIRRSRFAVIPPNTGEDFGLVALEARHLGVPCLITRDGGVPEAAGQFSMSCSPGNVEELTHLLQYAAGLSETDYSQLAFDCRSSLEGELARPEFYGETYLQIIRMNRSPSFTS